MQRCSAIDGGDLHDEIARLEARIDELAETIEKCRKFILMSKLAVLGGAILLAAIAVGAVRFDPIALVGAITAMIGGTVLFGSNGSTLQQASSDLHLAEAQRIELIGEIELRLVDESQFTRTLH